MKSSSVVLAAALGTVFCAMPAPALPAGDPTAPVPTLSDIVVDKQAATEGRVKVSRDAVAPLPVRGLLPSGARVLGSVVTSPKTSSPTDSVRYDVYFLDARRPAALLVAVRTRMRARGYKQCGEMVDQKSSGAFDYCRRDGSASFMAQRHGVDTFAIISETVRTGTIHGRGGSITKR